MSVSKRVYVLTFCKDINQLYGSLLVFKSIRIGFPTAQDYMRFIAYLLKALKSLKGYGESNMISFYQIINKE